MEYLHTMIRVSDLDASLAFYCGGLGLTEVKRIDNEKGRFTLVFLASDTDIKNSGRSGEERPMRGGLPMLELTYNWPDADGTSEQYEGGRNFGHVAFCVDDVYAACERFAEKGIIINRPPRDGYMAFVRSPDGISVEILQKGERKAPQEPWASMENTGHW